MTIAEGIGPTSRRMERIIKVLATLTFVIVIFSAGVVVSVNYRVGQSVDTLGELQRNHQASICTVSIIHAITPAQAQPAPGEDPAVAQARATQAARENFRRIFTVQWMHENCGLTEDEANRVLAG